MSDDNQLPNHKIQFESVFVRIYYNFVDNWIYTKWIGPQNEENIRIGYEHMLLVIKSEHCDKLLIDDTDASDIYSETTELVMNNFIPRGIEAGMKYVAVVYSHEQFTRLSTDAIIDKLPPPIICIAFNLIEEAKDWLRTM